MKRQHTRFIIRPFGTKNGIDFDRVERELIRPAIEQARFSGGTTGEFLEQGNIRTDMFEQLLIADHVIADISIHNANAFYELGIRHAFRDKRTFLIKSKGDEVPFDLKTDRYLSYDASNPAVGVENLANALRATWDSQEQESPVYWSAQNGWDSLLTIANFGDEPDKVSVQLAYNGGKLVLPNFSLAPFESKTLNTRHLREPLGIQLPRGCVESFSFGVPQATFFLLQR